MRRPGEPSNTGQIDVLKERYDCPHFRILVIGRANAGKTTIIEKVCNVKQGTTPVIFDRNGVEITSTDTQSATSWRRLFGHGLHQDPTQILKPSVYRGEHDIEHQITYPGSYFIFHDSRGFEAGGRDEMRIVKNFIKHRSSASKLKDRLHAIWYCIPMDSPRPLSPSELKFFEQGTGKVPLVVIFTKFDAQVIQEESKLVDIEDDDKRFGQARLNSERIFQEEYLTLIMNTKFAPKAYVKLEHMNEAGVNCPQLTEKTADAIDIASLRQLFTSTQMNNLNLCIKDALRDLLATQELGWDDVVIFVMARFPHFWQSDWRYDKELNKSDGKYYYEERGAGGRKFYRLEFELEALQAKFGERREFANKLMLMLLSLFGEQGLKSSNVDFKEPKACQILTALLIILEQSFWMNGTFWEKVNKSINQFKNHDCVRKLESRILAIPPSQRELVDYLHSEVLQH